MFQLQHQGSCVLQSRRLVFRWRRTGAALAKACAAAIETHPPPQKKNKKKNYTQAVGGQCAIIRGCRADHVGRNHTLSLKQLSAALGLHKTSSTVWVPFLHAGGGVGMQKNLCHALSCRYLGFLTCEGVQVFWGSLSSLHA